MKYVVAYIFVFFFFLLKSQISVECFINSHKYYKTFRLDSLNNNKINLCEFCLLQLDKEIIRCDSVIQYGKNIKVFFTTIKKCQYIINENERFIKAQTAKKFNKKVKRILSKYENNGYPFVKIYIDSILVANDNITLLYRLNKNNLFVYDSLDVIGKKILSKKFLMSYLNLKLNNPYNESQVKKVDRLINDLLFIKTNTNSRVFFLNNKAIIRCYIEKKSTQQFYGIIGFSNPENKLIFTGELNFSLLNTLKHADYIKLNWKSYAKNSQKLNTSAGYPYLFNFPAGVEYNLLLDKQDTTYVNSFSNPCLLFYFQGLNSIGFSYTYKSSVISANIFDSKLKSFTSDIYGITIRYSSLDRQYLPRNGIRINFLFNQLYTKFSDSTRKNQFQITLHEESYIKLFTKTILKNTNTFEYISNIKFKNEMFKFGGSKNLRGFDEESILANAYYVGSVELRYILGNETQVYPFYDFSSFIYENKKHYAHAIGWGIELYTKNGILFVSYAIGKINPYNFLFQNAKVHFGYKTLF